MRLLFVLLFFIVTSANAQEEMECTFNEKTYFDFINEYREQNKNASIEPDGRTLIVKRNNEVIKVEGGGCHHLGVAIDMETTQTYTEEQFLQKTLDLAIEFGDWLINTDKLRNSIDKGDFQIIDGVYYIQVDIMTVFDATYDGQGNINVGFYIN
jgi:Fe-S cluster assembly iron-binding protein IscA